MLQFMSKGYLLIKLSLSEGKSFFLISSGLQSIRCSPPMYGGQSTWLKEHKFKCQYLPKDTVSETSKIWISTYLGTISQPSQHIKWITTGMLWRLMERIRMRKQKAEDEQGSPLVPGAGIIKSKSKRERDWEWKR